MSEHEVTREMTFEEECKILEEDMHKLLKMEDEHGEPPFANLVACRAYRCIQKLLIEIQQYRELGTVEEFAELQNSYFTMSQRVRQYEKIGTIKELRDAREKQVMKEPELYGDCEDGKLLCPNCQEDLMDLLDCGFANCPYCGQAIDWNREEN